MPYGFFFDNTRCTGCRTCAMACADYNDLPAGRKYRRVIDVEGGSTVADANGICTTDAWAYHISLACNHCSHPECVHVCPTGAMHKNDLGLVEVDYDRCVGCGYCTIACPYHAPSIDPVLRQSSKCHGCSNRVREGKRPICVEACPLRALDFGDVGELKIRHGAHQSVIWPLPSDEITHPSLMVKLSAIASSERAAEGAIVNGFEIENNYQDQS